MKKILLIISMLWSIAYGQTTGYFRYDSTRFEKVGGNNELIILNSTRDSIGVLFNMGNGRTKFRTVSSLGITPNVRNGIRKSVDTLMLGDSLDRYTYLQIRNNFINNSSFNALRIGNRTEANSLNGIVGNHPLMLTYRPTPFSIEGVYSSANGDIDSVFYGGNISTVFQLIRDSTDALFKAGARSEYLPGIGGEFVGQYYPPRDSMVLRVGRDGQSGNVIFGQLDIGHSWGYNMNIVPPTDMPLFPISAARTSIDLIRVIDNTRRKKIVGAGISGFTTMYKSYQTAINTSTYEAGNYWENMFGLRAYGDAYPLISGATKAKTLLVATVKNAYGFYADPQYRYTNTVDNGYSFYAAGDTDLFVNKGFAYFGNNSPVRSGNAQGLRYRIYNNGRYWGQDSVHGFIVDGYGMSVQIPKSLGDESTINFVQKDTSVTASIGSYTPANRDSRGFYIRSEGYTNAVYDNNGTGFYVQIETGGNHANITRWWRNGNMAIGHSLNTVPYRLYKKLAVDGASVFLDTLTLKNLIQQQADSTTYKPLIVDATGNIYKGYWAYAGSGVGGGGSTAWSALTDPTASLTLAYDDAEVNTFTNGSNTETFWTVNNNSLTTGTSFKWNTNSLTTGNLLSINNTSTALASGNKAVEIRVSGANGTNAITATGLDIAVTNTNATSGTNIAAALSASGASTDNIALKLTGGLMANTDFNGLQPSLSVFKHILGASNADTRTVIVSNNAAGNTLLLTNTLNGSAGFYLGGLGNDLVMNNISAVQRVRVTNAGAVIIGTSTTALAWLSLPAGTTSANTAPIKLASGTSMTSAEAGAIEYTTDDLFFTISTGTARKRFLFADAAGGLTSGRIPFATTNGRLTDASDLTFSSNTLSLSVGNGLRLPQAALSTNTTLDGTYYTVGVSANAGNITITLPVASGNSGRIYVIKKTDASANTVTIDGDGSELIDGTTTKVLTTQHQGIMIQCTGGSWMIISTF